MKYRKILSVNDGDFCVGEIHMYHGFPTPPCHTEVRGVEDGRFINRFFYVVKGSTTFEFPNNTSLVATAGDIVYLPYGAPYRSMWSDGDCEFVNLLFEMLDLDGEEISLNNKITVIYKDTSNKFLDAFYKMHSVYHARTVNWKLLLRADFYNLLARLLYELSYNPTEDTGFFPAINSGVVYLENNYMKNTPISELARKSNVSESTFRRNFIKLKGVSPIAYRNDLRLAHAHDFLSSGLFTVAEVASMVGISDLPYFSKSFKKKYQITPTECIWLGKHPEK